MRRFLFVVFVAISLVGTVLIAPAATARPETVGVLPSDPLTIYVPYAPAVSILSTALPSAARITRFQLVDDTGSYVPGVVRFTVWQAAGSGNYTLKWLGPAVQLKDTGRPRAYRPKGGLAVVAGDLVGVYCVSGYCPTNWYEESSSDALFRSSEELANLTVDTTYFIAGGAATDHHVNILATYVADRA